MPGTKHHYECVLSPSVEKESVLSLLEDPTLYKKRRFVLLGLVNHAVRKIQVQRPKKPGPSNF